MCDVEQEIMNNRKFIGALKQVVFAVFILSTCCIGTLCSFLALNKRYQLLENQHNMYNKVIRILNDPEKGSKLKAQLQKARKSIQKISKSGK